jgi:hypothetical protein
MTHSCKKQSDRSNTPIEYCYKLWQLCGNVEGQQERGERFSDFFSDFGKIPQKCEGQWGKNTLAALSLNTPSIHLGRWRNVKHFVVDAEPSKERSVALLLDNHDSHLSTGAVYYCKQQGVTVPNFPPRCSHKYPVHQKTRRKWAKNWP